LTRLLTISDRQLGPVAERHAAIMAGDPGFYVRLAVWYLRHGTERLHQALFMGHLLTSSLPAHREAGAVLLRGLSPYQLARIVDVMSTHGRKLPRSARVTLAAYLRERHGQPSGRDCATRWLRQALQRLGFAPRSQPGLPLSTPLPTQSPCVPILPTTHAGRLDLLDEILATPLPIRYHDPSPVAALPCADRS